jgi:NADH-quinone oxidoreductase subunit L
MGKSAQFPLHVWLPDAMAGPTPVSALIHAATMVTAGVYLVARTHPLFLLAPTAMQAVAVVGLVTMLVAGLCALAQHDVKRVLAYSTISQVGFMFLALGLGAWTAAIFHLVTHACFKALLFLGVGSVLVAVHHERDLRELGGLRHRLPMVFVTCTIGSLALSGFPLLTGGFYSKDEVLLAAAGSSWTLWALASTGAVLTSLYTFRLLLLLFFGPVRKEPHRRPSWAAGTALASLAVLTIAGAALGLPDFLGGGRPLEHWLGLVLPAGHAAAAPLGEVSGAVGSGVASLLGLGLAAWIWALRPEWWARLGDWPLADSVSRFLRDGFGFDALYDAAIVVPFTELGRLNRDDVVDMVAEGTASLTEVLHDALARTQNGRLRWYMAATAAGAVGLLGLALWGVR